MRIFLPMIPFALWLALVAVIAIGPEIPWMCRPLFAGRADPEGHDGSYYLMLRVEELENRAKELERRVAELEKTPKIWGGSIDPGICPTPPGGYIQTVPCPGVLTPYISTGGVLLIDMPDRKVGL